MTVRFDASSLPVEMDDRSVDVPAHVAIIMDGNGRWARARGLPRTEGHRRGVEAVRKTVRYAVRHGIDYLTLFSFSSENWSRPPSEVAELLTLLRMFIRSDISELDANNVKIRIIGARDDLSDELLALLEEAETRTVSNTGLNLVVAFNYGGRDEILRAARRIAESALSGRLDPQAITEDVFSEALDTKGIPDPDLILRTSGEQRLSNFLLWQAAYAEFVFVPTYWPDFDDTNFDAAIAEFRARDRRFGRVEARAKV